MAEPVTIKRTAGSMSMYEFNSADESLPFYGVLTVDDGSNASRFQLIDRNTMSTIFTVMPADALGAIGALMTAAAETIDEITLDDNDLHSGNVPLS